MKKRKKDVINKKKTESEKNPQPVDMRKEEKLFLLQKKKTEQKT